MSQALIPPILGAPPVAKTRTNRPSPGSGGRQVAFRAPDDLYAELERAANGLGLDISNLVRMVLRENIMTYVRRAEAVLRQREQRDGD